jgi:hypothetical protein
MPTKMENNHLEFDRGHILALMETDDIENQRTNLIR